jgi:hypothetical protein
MYLDIFDMHFCCWVPYGYPYSRMFTVTVRSPLYRFEIVYYLPEHHKVEIERVLGELSGNRKTIS